MGIVRVYYAQPPDTDTNTYFGMGIVPAPQPGLCLSSSKTREIGRDDADAQCCCVYINVYGSQNFMVQRCVHTILHRENHSAVTKEHTQQKTPTFAVCEACW